MASNGTKPSLKLQTNQSGQEMPPPSTTDIVSAATPSTENPRPILKLNTVSRQSSFSGDTPTPSGEKKTIRIRVSQPNTPAVSTPSVTKTKAGRSSIPTAKLIESKKRGYDSDGDEPMVASRPAKIQKIIKMKTGRTPAGDQFPKTPISLIKWKSRGDPVPHEPGDAYDSEASDREVDPVRESLMILRTIPGPSTEYLHKALEEGTIGAAKPHTAKFNIRFLDGKERRAIVSVDGLHFAAVLVDLPTVTEAMKTWDRKSMMKNSDITQMLLCYAEVKNEIDAKTLALPPMAQSAELKWPHGLTPPMHDAVNRRFRKGVSEKQLVSTTNQVKKLIADDAAALETTFEYLQDDDDPVSGSGEEDADGEDDEQDYFGHQPSAANNHEIDLQAMLEAELENDDEEYEVEAATPATQLEAATPMTLDATTPAAPMFEASEDENDDGIDEEDISEEDDDDDEDEELDSEELARQAEEREIQQEIVELQKKKEGLETQLNGLTNVIMQNRIRVNIQNMNKEIDLKKAKLNITDAE